MIKKPKAKEEHVTEMRHVPINEEPRDLGATASSQASQASSSDRWQIPLPPLLPDTQDMGTTQTESELGDTDEVRPPSTE